MAQNLFINITVDGNATKKNDILDHSHSASRGASASGDFTVSFDKTKVPSMNIVKSCMREVMRQLAGSTDVTP